MWYHMHRSFEHLQHMCCANVSKTTVRLTALLKLLSWLAVQRSLSSVTSPSGVAGVGSSPAQAEAHFQP